MSWIDRRRGRRAVSLMVTVLLAAGGAFAGTAAANHASNDVPTNSFFHNEIAWLTDNGIANGFPDGSFKPNDPIKRQQLALWLANFSDGIQLVSSPSNPIGSQSFHSSFAICPAGKRAVGGGAQTTVSDVYMTDSYPSASQDRWQVRWEAENDAVLSAAGVYTVWALCLPDEAN